MRSIGWDAATFVRAAAAAACAAVLAGCASAPVSESIGEVALGPNGHAEGHIVAAAGGDTRLSLSLRGDGRVEFAVKDGAGAVVQQGTLGAAEARLAPVAKASFTVTLDARGGTGAAVKYVLQGPTTDLTWDLSRAAGAAATPKK